MIKEIADSSLLLTDTHKRQARGVKSCGFITMTPHDFLLLTTTNGDSLDSIRKSALTLEEYNKFARSGENILPPWLDVEVSDEGRLPKGKVSGHEGRHRAAALMNQKRTKMQVFLVAQRNGCSTWRLPKYPDDESRWLEKRLVTATDFPNVLISQYNGNRVKIDLSTWVAIQ